MEHSVLDRIDPTVLGQRLREAREASSILPAQAGWHVGSSTEWIHLVESGRTRIDPAGLFNLARLYNTQVSLLLNGPLPYKSDEEAIRACIAGEIGEGALATFLGVDRLETRRRVQEYEARNV